MGNAMSDCFDRILPFEGGSYDVIALGLQESTYTIKSGGGEGAVASGGKPQAQRRASQALEDDCVLQLVSVAVLAVAGLYRRL